MSTPARDAPRWLGPLMLLAGPAIGLMIHLHPERLRAPAWVAYAAALAFSLCGIALIAHRMRAPARVHAWLGVALLTCLLTPFAWIALAAEDGRCRVRMLGIDMPGGAWLCRAAFAAAAAIGLLMLVLAVRQALRTRREDLARLS